jgi:photosystem II stability/assembly factor-like uncharacterized protein
VALALLAVSTPIGAQTEAPASGWVRLGNTGGRTEALPSPAHILAVSEDWPVGRLIVVEQATGRSQTVWQRSHDGGATWSAVVLPPGVTQVRLPPAFAGGQRVGLAVTASGLQLSTDNATTWQVVLPSTTAGRLLISSTFAADATALFLTDGVARLSADGGATWRVLASPIEEGSTPLSSVQLSPDFAHDRTLFAVADGKPFLGTVGADGGSSWHPISLSEDLPVEALFISPGFAEDRTLLATVSTIDPPSADDLTPEDLDPESATGAVPPAILVSRDGGTSWVPAQGLEREGLPYHWHAFVQLSPTFDQDRTAFAFAYAPWGHPSTSSISPNAPLLRRALFRSDDSGLTWHAVFNRDTIAQTDGGERLVLSPSFAQDRFAVQWSVTRDIIGRGHTCRVSRTVDGGETWTVARQGGTSYLSGDQGCADMVVGGPPGNLAALMATYLGVLEVLTTMPPASGGLPKDATVARDGTAVLVATIPAPPSSAGLGRGSTMFAARIDGSVWVLPAAP